MPLNDIEPSRYDFVRVVDGPHLGRYGVFTAHGDEGVAIVQTRDDRDELLHVAIESLRPDVAGKR